MKKDRLFADQVRRMDDFNFGHATAEVFDDMLERSIPLYSELQRMLGEIAAEFAMANTHVYDLGCSTGLTLESLRRAIAHPVMFIGVDDSQAMLDKCRENLTQREDPRRCEFVCADLNQGYPIENASVAVLNLTLQFIRPLYRDVLAADIYAGLNNGGCLIIVEKVLGNDSFFNRTFIKFYYDLKRRNGYSDMEIAQKREALENVLIPYRVEENIDLLLRAGFAHVDIFFKWYNFCGFLAVKQP